jgi:integrase
MSQPTKGVRLYWRKAGKGPDGYRREGVWIIRDGSIVKSTGCGANSRPEAERKLAEYISEKYTVPRERNRDPASVYVADVIHVYAKDIAPNHARPKETAQRLARLLEGLGTRTLAEINGRTSDQYVAMRGSTAAARRELEDLRAAIRHHWREGLCPVAAPVVLPDRAPSRERWLTQSEAARLLWAAWRLRKQHGYVTKDVRHVARFILVGLYTGTRAGAICGASLSLGKGGFVDLERGVFYRRGAGERETKKRQPPVRLPDRLLAHLRRWHRLGICRRYLIEWKGRPVRKINKAFRAVRRAAGLGEDVTPHVLRHTCATWLAQAGVPIWEAAGFLGMTVETFERVYGHHHPDHQAAASAALSSRTQFAHRLARTKKERNATNVVGIDGNARKFR